MGAVWAGVLKYQSCFRHVAIFLLVALITLQGLASGVGYTSTLGITSFQWKFLSAAEKAAVEKSLDLIRTQRMKDVSLSIVDDAGMQYTGTVLVTQDSTSFMSAVGWVPNEGLWRDYVAMTPSRTWFVWAPWKVIESVRGVFNFMESDGNYNEAFRNGLTDFHLYIGPNVFPNLVEPGIVTFPDWAKSLDYDSLRSAMQEYVNRTVTHFKGRIQYYHIWRESNWYGANANWPIERIIDIIQMEALTIRSIDPTARISIDLMNIFPERLANMDRQGRQHSWATEDFVNRMLAAGVPFDIIGLETHYGQGWPGVAGGMDTLYNRLVALSRFGMPIYVWEDGLTSYVDFSSNQDLPEIWEGWHGTPSEEKQAEFMVAGTLVYLGNPLVLGVKWYVLQDQPWDSPVNANDGVLRYPDGSRKESFYALQNLWLNLTTDSTIQSVNGVAKFIGLAGEYTMAAEGYLPVKIHVADGLSAPTFNITLTSTVPTVSTSTSGTTQASTIQLGQVAGSGQLILAGGVALMAVVAFTLFFVLRRLNRSKTQDT